MNVLITGGLGVNGSWVTKDLAARGLRPTVLDNRADFSLVGATLRDAIDFEEADLRDQDRLERLFQDRQFDAVIHMAAAVGHQAIDPDPKFSFDVNMAATAALLEIACRHKVKRFIYTSSRAVYGDIDDDSAHPTYAPIKEDRPLRPPKVYDLCKMACEGMGREFSATFGIEFVALRFGTIFGPGKTLRHRSFGILSSIIEKPALGEKVVIEKGGDQKDDMIFAADAAAGIVAALFCEKPKHHEYNISTGVGHTLGNVADAVRRHYPDAEIEIGPGFNYFGIGPNYSSILDNSRAQTDFGFTANHDLNQSVAKYYATMKELELLD